MNIKLMKRLIALDRGLASPEGIHVNGFGVAWAVTDKTVRREIAMLRKLGKATYRFVAIPGKPVPGRWRMRYRKGVVPLFR